MLEFIDEAFYEVTLTIEMLVLLALFFAIGTRRNHSGRALCLNLRDKGIGIIAFIGDHKVAREVFDERWALCDVAGLSGGETKAHAQTQCLDAQMQFAGKAPFTAP